MYKRNGLLEPEKYIKLSVLKCIIYSNIPMGFKGRSNGAGESLYT